MTKAKAKTKSCDCVPQVNKQLKEHGQRLTEQLAVNFKTGKARVVGPLLQVERLTESKKRTKLFTLLCEYCPFCGKRKDGA